jgi:hypothetical protein
MVMNVFVDMVTIFIRKNIKRNMIENATSVAEIMNQRNVVDMDIYLYIPPIQVRYEKQSQI